MKQYIVLLRGINVGGHRKMKMAELREQLTDMGLKNVNSYIQSGNIICESDWDPDKIAKAIKDKIRDHWAYDVPCMVVDAESWRTMAGQNPFLRQNNELDIKTLYVTIAEKDLDEEVLHEAQSDSDAVSVIGRNIYLCTDAGRSKTFFDLKYLEKKYQLKATNRNWKTVLKLVDMLEK